MPIYTPQQLEEEIRKARQRGVPETFIQARVRELQGGQEFTPTLGQPISTPTQAQPVAGEQEARQGLLRQIGSAMAKPFVTTAKNIAAVPVELARLGITSIPGAAKYGAFRNPFLSQQELERVSERPREALLEQAKAGAGMLAFGVPGGGTVPVAAARGAVAGGLAGIGQTRGTTTEEISRGALQGAALGGVTGGALNLVGRGIGAGVGKIREMAAQKLLGGTPAQMSKAITEKGIQPHEIAQKYGVLSRDPQKILNKLTSAIKSSEDEIQKEIQTLNKEVGNRFIPKQMFVEALENRVSTLNSTNNFAQAGTLQSFIEKFKGQHAGDYISAEKALSFVRDANKNLGAKQITTEVLAGQNEAKKVLAHVARSTLKNVSTKVKDALRTQEDLFTIQPIVKGTIGKVATGRGLSLSQLALGGGGFALGGVPGLLLGAAIPPVARSRPAAELALRATQTGAGIAGRQLPQIAGRTTERGLPLAAGMAGGAAVREPQPIQRRVEPLPAAALPDITRLPVETQIPEVTKKPATQQILTQEELQLLMITAELTGDKEALGALERIQEFQEPKEEEKELSATRQKDIANAKSGLRALTTVENEIGFKVVNGQPQVTRQDKLYKAAIPGSLGARKFVAARNEVMDILTRLRTGAQINEQELEFYKKQMPHPLDDPATIQYKLDTYRQLFNELATGQRSMMSEELLPNIEQLQVGY